MPSSSCWASAESDRLVQHVAQTVGALIRSSDIVARLDDDRVVAVLPRAPRGGAHARRREHLPRRPGKSPRRLQTPSVTRLDRRGDFPSCADDVYSLFDAADEALAWAQKNGRSQAVLAHARTLPASQKSGAQAAS